MNKDLVVSVSPHIHSSITTRKIMLDVIIALMPVLLASVIIFGMKALVLTLVTVASCVVMEYLSRIVMKREGTVSDLSAVVTGLLLAFNLPVTIHPAVAILGSFVAIVVVKQMFGGIGCNFVNPAIAARIVLMISFPVAMTKYVLPSFSFFGADGITTATVLSGEIQDINLMSMFFGNRAGCMGETCVFAILLGGIYLIVKKVISPIIPVCFISTVFIMALLFGKDPFIQVMSGGLMLGAVFMATDYVTSPLTFKGKIIFGIGCGIITILIRVFADMAEGVSFAIILMNIMVPLIERLTSPKKFGERGAVCE